MNKPNLENDGERMVPEHHKGRNFYGAHISRYEIVLPFIKNKTVLDIASGSGYGTKILSSVAKSVIGVDVSESAISYASHNYAGENIEYRLGDGKRIPLENNTIDVVVSYETIEHIKNYKNFLKEIKRVMKPNGVLLLSTPNKREYPQGNHFHYREFSYKELHSLLMDNFKSIKSYFQSYWLSSTILPQNLIGSEWTKEIKVINTCVQDEEEALYFLIVCSDIQLKNIPNVENVVAIGEKYRPIIMSQKKEQLDRGYRDTVNQMKKYKEELDTIKRSKSWRIISTVQKLKSKIIG